MIVSAYIMHGQAKESCHEVLRMNIHILHVSVNVHVTVRVSVCKHMLACVCVCV